MSEERLIAFIGVAVAVVVIPGPDMALVARNVVRGGTAAGYLTSLGIVSGVLAWGAAAAIGVAALLATSSVAFTALKLAGAAYLVWLGISTLRSHDAYGRPGGAPDPPIAWRMAWAQGALSAALNPKLGIFFLTLLPQFVEPGPSQALQAVQLVVLFEVIGLSWLLIYTSLLGAVGSVLARPRPRRILRVATGTALIGVGARVALDRT